MQVDEIIELSALFVKLGVNKIRLTGGEPLVRKGVDKIMQALSRLPVSLTLTTNGTRVHEFIDAFEAAGVRSINISLDTLDAEKFQLVTRRDNFKGIWNNIHMLVEKGLHVKINVVVMKGINDGEINDFIAWTKDTPVHVRFIEFMPFTGNQWLSNKVFTWHHILETIKSRFDFIPLNNDPHDTAKKYVVPGHAGTFAVISTMSAPFCGTCNRMRLTADGKMKNCLFSKEETDLLTALRNQQDVEALIHQCIGTKAAERGGQFNEDFNELHSENIQNRSMISIGG
ncbi:MAG: GTP 3',8-cyclase MoaA [Sediminibacterium sp.]